MLDYPWKGKKAYNNLQENKFIPKDIVKRNKYEKEFNSMI